MSMDKKKEAKTVKSEEFNQSVIDNLVRQFETDLKTYQIPKGVEFIIEGPEEFNAQEDHFGVTIKYNGIDHSSYFPEKGLKLPKALAGEPECEVRYNRLVAAVTRIVGGLINIGYKPQFNPEPYGNNALQKLSDMRLAGTFGGGVRKECGVKYAVD